MPPVVTCDRLSDARQRTLARQATVAGFGLFHGADVSVELLPAPVNHGLVFQRVDLPGQPLIPARVEYVRPAQRRTLLSRGEARVETVEHLLAALAGLWIDNCLIRLDACELPCGDGSALAYVQAVLEAGIISQPTPAPWRAAGEACFVADPEGAGEARIDLSPADWLILSYDLQYPGQVIPPQHVSLTITPESFVNELAFARTFALEGEAASLRRMGLGLRAGTDNLLVFGPDGPLDAVLRRPDECARHKLLDLLGDLALCGGRPLGRFEGRRSGHSLNHAAARRLQQFTEATAVHGRRGRRAA